MEFGERQLTNPFATGGQSDQKQVEGGYIVTAESAISLTTKKGFYLLVQATRLPYKTGL